MTHLVKHLLDRIEALSESQQDRVVRRFIALLEAAPGADPLPVVAELAAPGDPPLWRTASPEEQARMWTAWVDSHRGGPGIPDEALRRVNLYD
jgi:hypothetical protein